MINNIEVFTQNHIRINSNIIIEVDPFEVKMGNNDADYVLITHDHYDHFSPKDIEKIVSKNTIIIAPISTKDKVNIVEKLVKEIVYVEVGKKYNVGALEFETVASYNIGKPFHPKSANYLGYIIIKDGCRIYIAGDTDATIEAKNVKCDIAILPVGGTYTMNAKEAAELANVIKPKYAIPVHFGTVCGSVNDGNVFEENVGSGIKVVHKLKY